MLFQQGIKRKQWTDRQMLTAIDDVKRGMSCNRAADAHGVPRSTLKYHTSIDILALPWI